MTEHWNLQSNIKAKNGSQGTLFSGGKSQMNPQRRWPRGYTPERQKAVHEAVDVWHSKFAPDGDVDDPQENTPQTRHVFETLKRSSAPVSDMKGLSIEVTNPRLDALGGDRTLYSTTGYYNGNPEGWLPRGRMTLSEEAKGPTIIHELGHHASNLAGKMHNRVRTPRERGQEEGFADSYEDRHAPAYRLAPNGDIPRAGMKDRFDIADMRGTADYSAHPEQLRDAYGVSRPEHFAAGYAQARPMEGRRPNREDLYRASGRAFTAKIAPKQETLF